MDANQIITAAWKQAKRHPESATLKIALNEVLSRLPTDGPDQGNESVLFKRHVSRLKRETNKLIRRQP